MPRTAFTKRGDRLEEVPVEQLAVDEVVIVKPGERVPVEGVITAGESSIDQNPITGESVPVERNPGDEVYAGTINQDNALDVRMTRLARDNTFAWAMQLVAEAQEQKSPTQRSTEVFARRFVPAVLIGTLLIIVLLPLVFGWTWSASFYRGRFPPAPSAKASRKTVSMVRASGTKPLPVKFFINPDAQNTAVSEPAAVVSVAHWMARL